MVSILRLVGLKINVYVLSGIMYDGLSELADLSLQLQERSLSLSVANRYILRIIRIFDSMANTYGPRAQEVFNPGALLKFKGVPLAINKSVPEINPGQFYTSLANYMRSRLFTTQASRVSKKIKMNLKINLKIYLKI